MKTHQSSFRIPWLQRWFGASQPVPVPCPAIQEDEIPRYPPFMKGLPAAPVARILGTQTELIQTIEQTLALPDALFRNIVLPVIARYAAFSHLLPASESHHHRGAGGLFRHGLEVAHWATLASKDCLFATDATPKVRKSLELRWRLAVCFAGLLHDIGKPVSDMAVIDQQGEHTWNPCDENLTDWANQHHIERYFLRWRENRHKRHEQFSALVIERVLTRESRAFILEPGPEIMQALLETIHGLDRGSKCYALVMAADCMSVERDLKAHYHGLESAMGMPVERYLCDAMRRLIKSGQWLANEKGARIWRFEDGLYIVWRTAVKEILSLLDKDHIPGIPRDEDTLADILIERGLAIPKSLTNGGRFRYWRMQTETLNGSLFMLRLSSIELMYSGEPPVAVIGAEVKDETESPVADQTPSISQSPSEPNTNVGKRRKVKAHDNPVKITAVAPKSEHVPEPILPADLAAILAMDALADSGSGLSDHEDDVVKDTIGQHLNDTASNASSSDSTGVIEVESDSLAPNNTQQDQSDVARHWLASQGQAGRWLIQLAAMVTAEHWRWGTDILEVQQQCLLSFPKTPDALKLEANQFIRVLEEKGWLVTDVLSPMRKVREVQQIRGVLLASEPSGMFKQLLANTTIPDAYRPQPIESELSVQTREQKSEPTSENTLKPSTVSSSRPATNPGTPLDAKSLPDNPTLKSDSVVPDNPEQVTAKPSKAKLDTGAHKKQHYRQAIRHWMDELQQAPARTAVAGDDATWLEVDEQAIANFLNNTPGLTRTQLMRELASHGDFRSVGTCLQLRRTP